MTGTLLQSNISSICCDPAVPWWGVALYNWPQKLKSSGNTRDHCSWGTFVPQIQFGLTRVFLSPPRYDWCAPLSHPSSCMLVNHGPSQQSFKEERRIQAMEMRCYRKILNISYKDHVTNEEVRAKIQQAIGPHEDLLTIVKRRKLQCYGHVSHYQVWPNHLAKHSEREKKTRQTEEEVGRQHQGMDRPCVQQVPEGSGEQGKLEKTGCKIIFGAPTTRMVKG